MREGQEHEQTQPQAQPQAQARAQLLQELAAPPRQVNALRVRALARQHPGLISSAGVRLRVWSLLLLGSQSSVQVSSTTSPPATPSTEGHVAGNTGSAGNVFAVLSGKDSVDGSETNAGGAGHGIGLLPPEMPCEEMHVLEADLKRTRSDMECFRSTSWRRNLLHILQQFCNTHSVQYKQGMNELLLMHVDPQLGQHLYDNSFIPELYAPQWFLCIYARGLPLPLVLRLWDMLIAVDDPAFTFFIGLALLRSKREALLLADSTDMPEIIGNMRIESDESSVDAVLEEAWSVYQQAPRCFKRYLRICCVRTPELAPSPPGKVFVVRDQLLCPNLTHASPSAVAIPTYNSGAATHFNKAYALEGQLSAIADSNKSYSEWNPYYVGMARQSVRRCVLLQASELVSALCPIDQHTRYKHSSSGDISNNNNTENSSDDRQHQATAPQHFVLIDIRSAEEISASGGGDMPTSIRMDPSFLESDNISTGENPQAVGGNMLEKWLDHFDNMRGLHLCIVDMPPAHATGGALWRRLLLGQGDGLAPTLVSYDAPSSRAATTAASAYYNSAVMRPSSKNDTCDEENSFDEMYHSEEVAAAKEDQNRPAVHLASILQAHGFPFVSVLDGGFPALLYHLRSVRGDIEPLVIHHDPQKYQSFMIASGRAKDKLDAAESNDFVRPQSDLMLGVSTQAQRTKEKYDHNLGDKLENAPVEDFSSDLHIALSVARQMNHNRMAYALECRIQALKAEHE